MPIYEYACRSCGHSFEKRLKYEERLAAQTCTHCGEPTASLIMSVPARVGGSNGAADDLPMCPSTGEPCGCGRGGHVH